MYQFKIVTIFPELFTPFCQTSLIGKAVQSALLQFEMINLRDFTTDRHCSVDDTPYGGGSGMVMKPQPVADMFALHRGCHCVFMTPQGKPFKQADARRLAQLDKPLLLFCGRYEGLDERAVNMFDEQISLGDFVLNGGETAAMAVIESVSRLLPGVIGNMDSVVEESHSNGLLEYPHYTRPECFDGQRVPPVLLSGNHGVIAKWRHGQSLLRTHLVRPDLLAEYDMTADDKLLLDEALREKERDET